MGTIMYFEGEPLELYPIGDLAAALERSPATVRRWEQLGILRKGFRLSSSDQRGDRRLYTQTQIDLVVDSARKAGITEARSSREELGALAQALRRIPREIWFRRCAQPEIPGLQQDGASAWSDGKPWPWAEFLQSLNNKRASDLSP
jgi:hypothetical protein